MPRTILDVSRWQGSIDWDKVKASGLISGVMIRAMGNSKEGKPSKPYIDPYFARNYAECQRLGIPVAQGNSNSGSGLITLEEKQFGVSLKFTPTVLGDGRINLKVNPEVSELSPQGVTITSTNSGGTQILPAFSVRRATTTVQLMDGQSFAIGGLIKNNVVTSITAFPFLGELPVIGALFRSSSFRNDRSELVFVITPRLVRPLPPNYALPTDNYIAPTRNDILINGRLEGQPPAPPASDAAAQALPAPAEASAAPANGGFEVK